MDAQETTVGAVVAADYRTAAIFSKYGIDFCCNGNKSIEDACHQGGISAEEVHAELEKVKKNIPEGDTANDYNSWPLDLLADYVERKHHRYVKEQLPVITGYIDKICSVHGDKHPELLQIQPIFAFSARELSEHMQKEEKILFPYIRQLALAAEGKGERPSAFFGSVKNPIWMMTHEHDAEGQRFRSIRELSGGFATPADGCNTYRTTYSLLDAFEKDLHLHIHLENNILFPKAIELEQKLQA